MCRCDRRVRSNFFGISFVGAILRLRILVFLYFKLFFVLQTCILRIYTYPYHSEGFFEVAKPFLIPLRSKLMYTSVQPYYSSLHISSYFFSYLFLFFSFYILPLLILIFFYLNCLLYYRHAFYVNTTWQMYRTKPQNIY